MNSVGSASFSVRVVHLSLVHRQRQRKGESGSLAHFALEPDPAAVELNELPRERQPEVGALDLLVCRPYLPELFEVWAWTSWTEPNRSENAGRCAGQRQVVFVPRSIACTVCSKRRTRRDRIVRIRLTRSGASSSSRQTCERSTMSGRRSVVATIGTFDGVFLTGILAGLLA